MQGTTIEITDQGITALYDDDLDLEGQKEIERASTIEPGPDGKWHVILSNAKRNGALAGREIGNGFERRADALAAEVAFINKEILSK